MCGVRGPSSVGDPGHDAGPIVVARRTGTVVPDVRRQTRGFLGGFGGPGTRARARGQCGGHRSLRASSKDGTARAVDRSGPLRIPGDNAGHRSTAGRWRSSTRRTGARPASCRMTRHHFTTRLPVSQRPSVQDRRPRPSRWPPSRTSTGSARQCTVIYATVPTGRAHEGGPSFPALHLGCPSQVSYLIGDRMRRSIWPTPTPRGGLRIGRVRMVGRNWLVLCSAPPGSGCWRWLTRRGCSRARSGLRVRQQPVDRGRPARSVSSALAPMTEAAFVAAVTERQPTAPMYFEFTSHRNREVSDARREGCGAVDVDGGG